MKYSIPGARFESLVDALVALEEFCREIGSGANIESDAGRVCTGCINEDDMFETTWYASSWDKVRETAPKIAAR